MSRDELDVRCGLFGFRIESTKDGQMAELYMEDDGKWSSTGVIFNTKWLSDLVKAAHATCARAYFKKTGRHRRQGKE